MPQVSRKQFHTGLDSLFNEEAELESNFDNSPLLVTQPATARQRNEDPKESRSSARKPSKSFTPDLEGLFSTVVSERQVAAGQAEDFHTRMREKRRGPIPVLSGLDALIRDTSNGQVLEEKQQREAEQELHPDRKRVTFTYDRRRFEKLKAIARAEGAYLKDIIADLLNDYIKENDRKLPTRKRRGS